MNISVFIGKNSRGHVDCLQNIKGTHCYRNSPRAWPLKALSLKKKELDYSRFERRTSPTLINPESDVSHGKLLFTFTSTSHLLTPRQKITTLSPSPEPSDWSAVSINTDLYLGTIRSSVSNLIDRFQEELKKLYGKGETASQNGPKNKVES